MKIYYSKEENMLEYVVGNVMYPMEIIPNGTVETQEDLELIFYSTDVDDLTEDSVLVSDEEAQEILNESFH